MVHMTSQDNSSHGGGRREKATIGKRKEIKDVADMKVSNTLKLSNKLSGEKLKDLVVHLPKVGQKWLA